MGYIILGYLIIVGFHVYALYCYRRILYHKGKGLGQGSRIEFLKGEPFAIITEKEYVEYIMLKTKVNKNRE